MIINTDRSFPIFERLLASLMNEFLGRDEFGVVAQPDASDVDPRTRESGPQQFPFQITARHFEELFAL